MRTADMMGSKIFDENIDDIIDADEVKSSAYMIK